MPVFAQPDASICRSLRVELIAVQEPEIPQTLAKVAEVCRRSWQLSSRKIMSPQSLLLRCGEHRKCDTPPLQFVFTTLHSPNDPRSLPPSSIRWMETRSVVRGTSNSSSRSTAIAGSTDSSGVARLSTVSESKQFQFRFEAFNVFNHAQFGTSQGPDGNINSSTFGLVTAARDPRIMH